jgi:hypothetical protein
MPVGPGANARLFNISTRLRIASGGVGIGGFIITGSAPKKVIVRAIGPSLQAQGLENVMADPVLTIHGEQEEPVASNDNWQDGADSASQLSAIGMAPASELEAALVVTLPPGKYTAVVESKNATGGTALVELYDGDLPGNSELGNISTLGFSGAGNDALIAGFVVGSGSAKVVVRALGPSLTQFGVANALENPTLDLHDANGSIAGNDDWENGAGGDAIAVLFQPTDPREAAVQINLAPGNYTAVVQGKDGSSGVALVEAYNLK